MPNRFIAIAFIASLWAANATMAAESSMPKPVVRGAHHYTVQVQETLDALTIRAQFDHEISSFKLNDRGSVRRIRALRRCDSDDTLSFIGGRINVPVDCFEYTVRLKNSVGRSYGADRYKHIQDRMTTPDHWMVLPVSGSKNIEVTFVTPPGINVSVPWKSFGDNHYQFGRYALSSDAITAFGPFEKTIVPVSGGELRVSILRSGYEPQMEKMTAWLKAAADNVARVHGNFPMKSTQVVIVPVNGTANEAVPFGRVIRDGGEAVQFFVNTARPLEEFVGDWTATHEFSHLLFPYVKDRWVSEGFASYYQNVLMARGEVYAPQRAWQKLYEGFERGKRSAPGLSPRSATMRNGGLMKMYWSGAAIALMADIRLRVRSEGKESLDTVARKVRYCCLPSRKAYTDREFFAQLDAVSGYQVFTELYEEYANAAGFPDITKDFEQLGLAVRNGRVTLIGGARDDIRDAIMRGVSDST